ncbi:MAG: Ig domain-containing protein, partial [Muribaculaceae bacterium]|nr:Ig domain-containing protein [Muribaculaceae bacterium]
MKQKKFTDLFLVCFAVVFFGITAKAQSIVPKWECSALTDTIVNTNGQIVFEASGARKAIGVNNRIYLPNNTTGCVEEWENGLKRKVWDVNSFMIEKEQTYTDSNGETKADFYKLWCFGASDDAGNIIVNAGSYADRGHGTKWVVIPADGSAMRLLDIKEFPNSITTGRVYNGVHVVGNLMKEAYLFTADENSGYIIAMNVFPNGTDMGYNLQKSWAIPCSYIGSLLECNIASNTDYETLSNATTLNDFASLIFVRKRTENRIFAWDGSNMYYYIVNNISIGTDGCTAHGFDIFKINNVTYYIVPFKNMIDGTGNGRNGSFEIRNFDTGEIVAQYNMSGLVDNVNQSFSVETDSDGKSATIYAYCQSNKMGVYSFYPQNNDETILAESLIIESEKVLKVGETAEITATISPTNVSNQNLNWTSSNEDVAIVSNGYVIAISAGTAKLTATTTDGSNLTSTCNITVIDDEENYLTMPSVDLYKGKIVTIPISLNNQASFTAFQCDLTLPDGVTCSKVTLSDRASDHTITKSQYSDNVVRIASISFTS